MPLGLEAEWTKVSSSWGLGGGTHFFSDMGHGVVDSFGLVEGGLPMVDMEDSECKERKEGKRKKERKRPLHNGYPTQQLKEATGNTRTASVHRC
jgi:hypothetical protein